MTYKQGATGAIVKKIQKVVGCFPDGIWGPLTTEAVKDWQQAHGLTADGLVGPATLAKMFPTAVAQTLRLAKSRRRIDEIIIHCTATPESRDYTVADITRWHKERGWSTIGYHYVIYRNGAIVNGRDVNVSGAHCAGHNAHSIGVCYVGGLASDGKTPKDTRTIAQREALLELLKELKRLYPDAEIYGHRNFSSKACPCFDARSEYEPLFNFA